MSRIGILVVDDHEMVRHGLRLSLELEPDMAVVGEASTGTAAVEVARETQPDVMLLDVRLGDADGPDVCRRVREVAPRTAIVMLTNHMQDGLILRSLMAGAKGYVIKDVSLAELKGMIRSVHGGGAVLDPKIAGDVIRRATGQGAGTGAGPSCRRGPSLSETDIDIMKGVAAGLTNRAIAHRVHLSPHTVKDRLEKIGDLLGARSRPEIVVEALRRGLI